MSHRDAIEMINDKAVADFLIAQRKKGREGCLLGVAKKEQEIERKRQLRVEQEEIRKEKAAAEAAALNGIIKNANQLYFSFSFIRIEKIISALTQLSVSSSNSSKANTISGSDFTMASTSKPKKEVIFTDRLLACLGKNKISNRVAMHVISATASSFGLNIENYVLNYSSSHRCREKYRESVTNAKINDFHVIINRTSDQIIIEFFIYVCVFIYYSF